MTLEKISSLQKYSIHPQRPKTLAELRMLVRLNTPEITQKHHISSQTLDFGSARFEYRKFNEVLNQLESLDSHAPELQHILESKVKEQLENLMKAVGQGEEGRKILMGCLSTILMMERVNRFEVVRNVVEDFAKQRFNDIKFLRPTESYIEEQARLFRDSFDKLYNKYLDQYVLFHDGEVLFSSKNLYDVTKAAYIKRKDKDIFIEKVSVIEDTYEVLTPVE